MKKIISLLTLCIVSFGIVGCTGSTVSKDEKGNTKTVFSANETATVNNTNIKINSIKKIYKECLLEYDGECQSYNEPKNDYFLLIDLTIENNDEEELNVSSMMSFELKDSSGEKGEYALLTNGISSQLDGSVMSGDILKGQIAYDVKDSDTYSFYYLDSLLDDKIKFNINSSDISE